jgi:flagellar motor switch protein FliG
MNETAIRVWKALDRGMNVREIAAHLESVYDIDPRTLESDVRELVESFSHFGMLPKTARRSPESS